MKPFYFTLPIFLLSCSPDKELDTASHTGSDTATEAEESIIPTLGDWKFSELEYAQDACNFNLTEAYSIAAFESNVYTLAEVSDTQVQFIDLYDVAFNCGRDGNTITCPSTFTVAPETYNDEEGNPVVDEDGNLVAPDATSTIDTDFVMTFSSAELGSLSATLTASCEGEDCQRIYADAGVSDNPCSSSLSGKTSLQ